MVKTLVFGDALIIIVSGLAVNPTGHVWLIV
jgi:hypothetical protein